MNKVTLRNILIISTLSAAVGAIVGYIVSHRTKLYFDNSDADVEYVNPMDIDIPIDVLMDEETE
jgi:hypothetical protein